MNEDSMITHKNEVIFMANRVALDLAVNGLGALENRYYQSFLSTLTFGNSAWVKHSLYIVIETLKKNLSFLDGFKYIVSQGGDTDTNCAIYGAIKGYKEKIIDEIVLDEFVETLQFFLIE